MPGWRTQGQPFAAKASGGPWSNSGLWVGDQLQLTPHQQVGHGGSRCRLPVAQLPLDPRPPQERPLRRTGQHFFDPPQPKEFELHLDLETFATQAERESRWSTIFPGGPTGHRQTKAGGRGPSLCSPLRRGQRMLDGSTGASSSLALGNHCSRSLRLRRQLAPMIADPPGHWPLQRCAGAVALQLHPQIGYFWRNSRSSAAIRIGAVVWLAPTTNDPPWVVEDLD